MTRHHGLEMLERRRNHRAELGLPEDRLVMWDALAEVHNGKPCDICGTDGYCPNGNYAEPPPNPDYT